jgi:hypothetical protein
MIIIKEDVMEEQSILHLMENWGYYLLPKSHPDSPGYTGLLVAIRKQPTEKHFDPQAMRLRLRDKHNEATWTTLGLHSPVELPIKASLHACPGEVILRDRTDKGVNFFVFGGSLEAVSVPGETVYSLRSPAPILKLTDAPESVPDQLASETEALIGELQVRWGSDERGFARRLAQADPFQFYVATLQAILARNERDHHTLQETFHEFYLALRNEKAWLAERGKWPTPPSRLEELLAPK